LAFLIRPPQQPLTETQQKRRARTIAISTILQMVAQPMNTAVTADRIQIKKYLNPLLQRIQKVKDPLFALMANGVLARQGDETAIKKQHDLWQLATDASRWHFANRALQEQGQRRKRDSNTINDELLEALNSTLPLWKPAPSFGQLVIPLLSGTTTPPSDLLHPRVKRQVGNTNITHTPAKGEVRTLIGSDIWRPPAFITQGRQVASNDYSDAPLLNEPNRDLLDPGFLDSWRSKESLEFIAYDCSQPSSLELVTVPEARTCDSFITSPITSKRNVTYMLMQKSDLYEISVKRCQRFITRFPYQCGAYDHMTLSSVDVVFRKEVPVTATECRQMWKSGKVMVETFPTPTIIRHREFPVHRNTMTQIQYDKRGYTYFSDVGDDEIECVGTNMYSTVQNAILNEMVEVASDEIILEEDTMHVTEDGEMSTVQSEDLFPSSCDVRLGNCRTGKGTYVWDPPTQKETCPIYRLRVLHGEEVMVVTNKEVVTIYSDDSKIVRLAVHHPVQHCGHYIKSTNF